MRAANALLAIALAAPGLAQETDPMARRTLPGTRPLRMGGDLAARMVASIRRYMEKRTQDAPAARERLWSRDFASPQAYDASVAPNRESLRRCIGAIDPRVETPRMELLATVGVSAQVARGPGYAVYAIRWPAFAAVEGEGLLLRPDRKPPLAHVVALPDADQAPETLAGLAPGLPPEAQFARRLAESGCAVLVPALIDRGQRRSGNPRIGRFTRQPHREWVYRMAYELGRHVIGYEVQKVRAAIDWFLAQTDLGEAPVGLFGYGEGGLLALHAAALDTRVRAACVSGYFREREELYKEPIYRNVWNLLGEFGDAGVASLVAPRALVVEASRGPVVGQQGDTPGTLVSPPRASTRREFARLAALYRKLDAHDDVALVGDGTGPPGSDAALAAFLARLDPAAEVRPPAEPPRGVRPLPDPQARLDRQLDQLVAHSQDQVRLSRAVRQEYWKGLDASSLEAYRKSLEPYRRDFHAELIGELPPPSLPPRPRTRLAYDQPRWRGYEAALDIWPAGDDAVFAYGILLVPKSLADGERRPVVVCQHGLEGRPQDLVEKEGKPAYHRFAARLADRGFVVFAPQNPYIGGDRFRVIQRLANPLKGSLFSVIIRQHQVITDWLASLPFVDPRRIAFYGLSYGGKTAMRVPPLVPRYCLSICSGDFNEWVWKNVTIEWPNSYMFTGEYEMYEFGLALTFNYAEMAALIAPRPFMVERGHRDGVGLDRWVAFEYAKVRRLYATLGIPERTEIEFFDGPHEIHGVGTFRFLHRHLRWPPPPEPSTP
ncbi:MAG: dienelactone hydrolase family protein [Candidatus Brocadiia bacterium]